MSLPVYYVDAFTNRLFSGNPAAVIFSDLNDSDLMQKIATENNLSETAFFINKNNVFDIRWFTPVAELDLAGHPTLAAAHIIIKELNFKLDKIIFKMHPEKGSREFGII